MANANQGYSPVSRSFPRSGSSWRRLGLRLALALLCLCFPHAILRAGNGVPGPTAASASPEPVNTPALEPETSLFTYFGHRVTLTWNPVSWPTPIYYNVIRCQLPCGSANNNLPTVINSSPLICPTYLDATVQPGVRYQYWVDAWDYLTLKDSAYSNSATVSVP
jgi:hypothetical protein